MAISWEIANLIAKGKPLKEPIESFSFSVPSGAVGFGTGNSTGRQFDVKEFYVTRIADKYSTQLLSDLVRSVTRNIKVSFVYDVNGKPAAYLTYNFEGCMFTSYNKGSTGKGEKEAAEVFTINFDKVTYKNEK